MIKVVLLNAPCAASLKSDVTWKACKHVADRQGMGRGRDMHVHKLMGVDM